MSQEILQNDDLTKVYTEIKPRLIAIDNEIMKEIQELDIDVCVSEIDDWINLKFKYYITIITNNMFTYEDIAKILNIIDKQIPGVPQASQIFEKLYIKNNFIKGIVDSLIDETVKYRDNIDGDTFDALRNAKLDHPFNILNTIPHIMKVHINNESVTKYYINKNTQFTYKLKGHTDKINYINGHPRIKQIATCSNDRTIRLWDLNTGKCMHILKHEYLVRNCSYKEDASELASSMRSKIVLIWDPHTGNKLRSVAFSEPIHHISWLDDYLLAASNTHLYAMKNDSTIDSMTFPCQERDYSSYHIIINNYKISSDGNDVIITSTNQILYFAYQAFTNSRNNLEKLLNLRSSKGIAEFSELESNELRAKLDEKINLLIKMNKLIDDL